MKVQEQSRSSWPWAIVAFFILAVAFLSGFIVWASRQDEDLVSPKYYEAEVQYQEQIDRQSRSLDFDPQVRINFDPALHGIVVSIPPERMRGGTGVVHLYRPSDSRLDVDVVLRMNDNGVQYIDARSLAGGLWKVRVQWSREGAEYFCERSVVVSGMN